MFMAILGVLAAAGGGSWWYVKTRPEPAPAGAQATAKRGTFPILVTETGTFAAKESKALQVEPEVFQGQLTIVKVTEAGAVVKKDDVLMEMDTSEILRQIGQAETEEQAAQNDVVQAKSDLDIQLIDNAIKLEQAKSDYESVQLSLRKWRELEAPKAIKEAEARIRESENALEEATRGLEVLKTMQAEELVAEAEVKKAALAEEKARTELEFNHLSLKLLKEYDHPLEKGRKENLVRDAKSYLDGRAAANDALKLQKESGLLRAEGSLREKRSHLAKLRGDVEKFVLKAPVDGILLYGDPQQRWNQIKIAVGEKVWAHHTLLTIPDLSAFKVSMSVAETDVNKIQTGMAATIRPEAIPGLVIPATVRKVSSVSVNSRPWDESSTGKFEVEMDLGGIDPRVKPGMKCKVEIVTDEVKDAVHVPVDAVFEKDGKPACWIVSGPKPEARLVKVGRSSADFVEILEGLREGETIALYDPEKAK